MEQKHLSCGSVCDRLPTLSVKYPWLVAQNLEAEADDTKDQIFYAMHDPLSRYRCQIPELHGRRIRGCFHGWVILSNHPHNVMWSLWNPVTSRTIHLPPLILKGGDFESTKQCCLSSPPNDPTSVLMLTGFKTPTIVFCHLARKRKNLRWKEMIYAEQLRSIIGADCFLHCLTCCNGKVYALITDHCLVIQLDIVVKDKEIVISLSAFGKLPSPRHNRCSYMTLFLKGYCKDLFHIKLDFDKQAKIAVTAVYLFKLNTTSMIWEEMQDLKGAIFVVDIAHLCSVFYRHAIAPELGGYIHILMGEVLCSYDVEDKTISLSSMPRLEQSTHLSLWECSLHDDHGEIVCETPEDVWDDEVDINNTMNEENFEPHLLSIPFDVLNMVMEFCVGVEYLNFRATCKHCQLAAPMIRWSNETARRRLQTYSLISPWLIVLDKHQGIMTFTDPMFGDKYFIKTPQELIGDLRIRCSRYGWLLLFKCEEPGELFFFNPFTNDIRKLPYVRYLDSLCFSAPPTSTDCVIVGLSASFPLKASIYCVTWESWRFLPLDFGSTTPHSFRFPTIYAEDIYALNQGALHILLNCDERLLSGTAVVAEAPRGRGTSSAQYFLVNWDQNLLLVIVDGYGESVEVLRQNVSRQEWEKIDSLGRNMIYICGTTCVCIEAKTPEMENKIYFPRLHCKSGKIVFYSLETCRYHTFNGRNIKQDSGDFIGTKYHVSSHAWIEPSWS